jgi:palmitoyltransferase
MAYPSLRSLAVPTVSFITVFLAISSQYLFYHLEPGHLKGRDFWLFNGLIAATCWSYERVCRADPGRLPKALKEEEEYVQASGHGDGKKVKRRWCKKCEAIKPPRAHHCRQCGRFVNRSGSEVNQTDCDI